MDVCVITNDIALARFILLELEEVGYEVYCGESARDARLYICDLDFDCEVPSGAIGFSYDEGKRSLVQNFLLRPIDALKLRKAVAKRLSEPAATAVTSIEVDSITRRVKTEKGEVRLSEKEFALFKVLCSAPLLSRDEGARIFGDADSNVVDVYMHYLRKKLAKVCDGETVVSKRGAGYSLSDALNIRFI